MDNINDLYYLDSAELVSKVRASYLHITKLINTFNIMKAQGESGTPYSEGFFADMFEAIIDAIKEMMGGIKANKEAHEATVELAEKRRAQIEDITNNFNKLVRDADDIRVTPNANTAKVIANINNETKRLKSFLTKVDPGEFGDGKLDDIVKNLTINEIDSSTIKDGLLAWAIQKGYPLDFKIFGYISSDKGERDPLTSDVSERALLTTQLHSKMIVYMIYSILAYIRATMNENARNHERDSKEIRDNMNQNYSSKNAGANAPEEDDIEATQADDNKVANINLSDTHESKTKWANADVIIDSINDMKLEIVKTPEDIKHYISVLNGNISSAKSFISSLVDTNKTTLSEGELEIFKGLSSKTRTNKSDKTGKSAILDTIRTVNTNVNTLSEDLKNIQGSDHRTNVKLTATKDKILVASDKGKLKKVETSDNSKLINNVVNIVLVQHSTISKACTEILDATADLTVFLDILKNSSANANEEISSVTTKLYNASKADRNREKEEAEEKKKKDIELAKSNIDKTMARRADNKNTDNAISANNKLINKKGESYSIFNKYANMMKPYAEDDKLNKDNSTNEEKSETNTTETNTEGNNSENSAKDKPQNTPGINKYKIINNKDTDKINDTIDASIANSSAKTENIKVSEPIKIGIGVVIKELTNTIGNIKAYAKDTSELNAHNTNQLNTMFSSESGNTTLRQFNTAAKAKIYDLSEDTVNKLKNLVNVGLEQISNKLKYANTADEGLNSLLRISMIMELAHSKYIGNNSNIVRTTSAVKNLQNNFSRYIKEEEKLFNEYVKVKTTEDPSKKILPLDKLKKKFRESAEYNKYYNYMYNSNDDYKPNYTDDRFNKDKEFITYSDNRDMKDKLNDELITSINKLYED